MLLLSQIRDAYEGQQEELRKKNLGIPRQLIRSYGTGSHIEVITGVRRCGKSTLLKQIAEKRMKNISTSIRFCQFCF